MTVPFVLCVVIAYGIGVVLAWWTRTPGSEREKATTLIACMALIQSFKAQGKLDHLIGLIASALERLSRARGER